MKPPVAARRSHLVTSPHGDREDPYYWLRDDTRTDPDVLAYVNAENAYTDHVLAPYDALSSTIFDELRARVKEDDSSVPVLDRGWHYYTRYETGKQYPIYCRRAEGSTVEEVFLDGNALAAGHAFFKIGNYDVSPDGNMLAYAEDTVGRNQFILRVKDLRTGALLPDTATNISGALAWASDSRTLFYGGKDPITLRADRVTRCVLGSPVHELVHLEEDGQYYVGCGATKSHRYITISMRSTTNAEIRLIDADAPTTAPRIFLARSADHLYNIDHLDGRFVVRTNLGGINFRLAEVAEGDTADPAKWRDVLPHRDDTLVEGFALYAHSIAVSVRTGGLRKVLVMPHAGERFFIDANDPAYVMSLHDTPEPTSAIRFGYESPSQPSSIYELDLATRARILRKQQPVPTYDPSRYTTEYRHARASDGTLVPVTIVYRSTTPRDGSAPLLVYGYGSYGICMEPGFSSTRVSLLDRGWVYAIAHIRGGQDMGRHWYEAGKLQQKRNTFTDFIAVTEFLVAERFGARDKVIAMGGSAGGLLVGAVVNLRPDLYRGIVSFVPFVDVVTTMLDESIPLTTNEYAEWGNPTADRAAYEYMLSYSPYDNISAQRYPAIYVRTGLWDSQVQYFEPAKWVAKLRATKLDDNWLLLDTNMAAGHGGASGRFDALKEIARAYSFMLGVVGAA